MRVGLLVFFGGGSAAVAPAASLPHRALAPAAASPSGGSGALQKGFGPCVGGERNLFFYSDGPTTCPASKQLDVQMAEGLECNLRCAPGKFLSAERTTGADHKVKWQSACEACPKGKFSVGGGQIYSGMNGAWASFPALPLEFHSHCVSRRAGRWVEGEHCAPWEKAANGTILTSGNNTGRAGNEARPRATLVWLLERLHALALARVGGLGGSPLLA